MAINSKDREKCERLIYQVWDALDPSGVNSEHYKKIFTKMSNNQFESLMKKTFPLKFHYAQFEIEPKMSHIRKALGILKVPVLEKVNMPFIYSNKDGVPVCSKSTYVGYLHIKKVQQFITKKNSMSTDISQRDMKTGLLIKYDKNGKTSDAEANALTVNELYNTLDEMQGPRADMMASKNAMYSAISSLGYVSRKDFESDPKESLALNMVNVYLLGAMLNTNLLNTDVQLSYTLDKKQRDVSRA